MITDPINAVRFYVDDEVAPYTFLDSAIQEFLDLEQVPDANDLYPDDTGYIPTYDVLRAAGRAFLWLASQMGAKESHRVGDLTIKYDMKYYHRRGHELMGGASQPLRRRDEIRTPDHLWRYRS